MDIIERKKALEAVLRQKTIQLQASETQRNALVTEMVQIQGKLELLDELEHESSIESTKQKEREEKK